MIPGAMGRGTRRAPGWYVGNQGLGIVEPVGGLFTHDFCQRLIALLTRRDESDIEFGAQRTGQSAAQAQTASARRRWPSTRRRFSCLS